MVSFPVLSPEHTDSSVDNDRIAVLLMGYGEVENYEDFANYNEQALNLLTAKFAPVPTWVYPPLAKILAALDWHEWGHRHDRFISPHNQIFERQRAGIERYLQKQWGDRIQVFKAFNFCQPFLPTQIIQEIHRQGFTKLLIYPLLVVDSIFTSGITIEQVNWAISQIANPNWPKDLRYIPSFHDQPAYIQLLADLVTSKIEQDLAVAHLPSQIGIILMNHGCPHEAKGFTSGIDESQILYEKVRTKLINRYPLISVGWLNHQTPLIKWTQPHVELAGRNLINLGATALLFVPIGFATENHETILDVHHIIHNLQRHSPQVRYMQMPCVNDQDDFLAMAADWASEQIHQLLHGLPANHRSHHLDHGSAIEHHHHH